MLCKEIISKGSDLDEGVALAFKMDRLLIRGSILGFIGL